MPEISGSPSAAYQASNIRSELATNAIRDSNDQERQVVETLTKAQDVDQQDRREQRQIPGLGEAVDITA